MDYHNFQPTESVDDICRCGGSEKDIIHMINKQFYKDNYITLFTRQDHLMPEIKDETIDVIVCDPPYGVKYQSNTRVATPLFAKIADDDNLAWVPEFLTESFRVLKKPGAMFLFTTWIVEPEWEQYVTEAKFMMKQLCFWDKSDSAGGIGDLDAKFYEVIEEIMYCTKGRYLMHSKRRSNVFRYHRTPPKDRWHPIQKPEALLQDMIQCLCEGKKDPIILDPYAGSGSTLMAAKKLGYKSIGYELPPDKEQNYAERMASDFQQTTMLI